MYELRQHVYRKDKSLGSKLNTIWEEAARGIHDKIQSSGPSAGGAVHSEAVEGNIWRLNRELRLSLTPVELFVLSAAAALHDAAKVPQFVEEGQDHGRLSERLIRQHPDVFRVSKHEAAIVGLVVGPHNDGNLDALWNREGVLGHHGGIGLLKLASLFRLCDMLDIAERVSHQIPVPSGEEAKTLFRDCVSGWKLNNDKAICICATADTPGEYNAVLEGVERTRKDLEPIVAALQHYELPHRFGDAEIDTARIGYAEADRAKEDKAFIGLNYYQENDAEVFRGRDREIDELLGRVIANPVSVLVGASGSGKTSLILAGLSTKLTASGWKFLCTRPWLSSNNYVRHEDFQQLLGYVPHKEDSLAKLVEAVSEKYPDSELAVCLDQFEDASELLLSDIQGNLRQLLRVVSSRRLPKVHLLVAYRVEAEASFGRLWQDIAGSATGLPRMYLNPLTSSGAREALEDILRLAKVGLHPSAMLTKRLLDDLELETRKAGFGSGVYPPYLRILAETVISSARRTRDKVLSLEMYEELGGVGKLIGAYLFKTLDRLGGGVEDGKRVLAALITSAGTKQPKSLEALVAETQMSPVELKGLLGQLADLRLVRIVGTEYEIAHDYLADLVRLNLASLHDLELKALREMLGAKARSYPHTRELLSATEMRSLYQYRKRIAPSATEQEFVLLSMLGENLEIPGWYWLQAWNEEGVCKVAERMLEEEHEGVSPAAVEAFTRLADDRDLKKIERMLRSNAFDIHENAARAFGRLTTEDNLPMIEQMLRDRNPKMRLAAATSFGRLATRANLPKIERMLKDEEWAVRMAAVESLGRLAIFDASIRQMVSAWHEDMHVRISAVKALGRTGSHDDVFEIEPMLSYGNEELRAAAVEAVGRLGTRDDLAKVERLLLDDDLARIIHIESKKSTLCRIGY